MITAQETEQANSQRLCLHPIFLSLSRVVGAISINFNVVNLTLDNRFFFLLHILVLKLPAS